MLLLAFTLAVTVGPVAVVQSEGAAIWQFPLEVRRQNVVRLSREQCDDCATMEAFYEANSMAFILFYERALLGQNTYKGAIVAGFLETCADLRWSRIGCGLVDMIEDREYGERYIDPKTAPAHIVVRDGEPLLAQKRHVERLMQKPGDKASMLWHLGDILAPKDPESLWLVREVRSVKAFKTFLGKHAVVVAAGVRSASSESASFFASAVQKLVLGGNVSLSIPGLGDVPKKAKETRARQPLLFVIVVGSDVISRLEHPLADGSVAAWVGGKFEVAANVTAAVKSVKSSSRKELRYAEEILKTVHTASEVAVERRRSGGRSSDGSEL